MHGKKKWIALSLVLFGLAVLLLWKEESPVRYYHNQGQVFGTYYNIQYEGSEDFETDIQEAFQRFDNSMSMFNPTSVISKINRDEDVETDTYFEQMWAEPVGVRVQEQRASDASQSGQPAAAHRV